MKAQEVPDIREPEDPGPVDVEGEEGESNIKLGKRMKAILCHLAKKPEYSNRQDHIIRTIEGLYRQKLSGDGTFKYFYDMDIFPALRSSYCRAFKTLLKHG
jgi:hypothetical protein